MKIILIPHFQNKTGSSGNTSMFQITVRVTTMVTCKQERFSRAPTSCGLCSFPQQNGAERASALISPFREGCRGQAAASKDHSEHLAATRPGTLSVSSPVCFHWESSGDTSPGFPNTEGWSMSNRKGFSFLSESGELHAQTCSEFQAPGF